MQRYPVTNWVLIGVTVVLSVAALGSEEMLASWVLWRIGPLFEFYQFVTCVMVHADPIHLIGNMVFLFVFGNAVNAKLGHWQFLVLYFAIGALSSLLWWFTGPGFASLGASGAIMGILGVYLILYPRNEVACFWWWGFRGGTFRIGSFLLILIYIAFDIWGLVRAGGGTNYTAHVGGMVLGILAITLLILTGLVRSGPEEENVLEWFGFKGRSPRTSAAAARPRASVASLRPVRRRYMVHATDQSSGFRTDYEIDAYSEAEIREKAGREGLFVQRIELLPEHVVLDRR